MNKKLTPKQASRKAFSALNKAANYYVKLFNFGELHPASSSWDSLGEMPTLKDMKSYKTRFEANYKKMILHLKEAAKFAQNGGIQFEYENVDPKEIAKIVADLKAAFK